jgi:hypothetical protein
VHHPFGAGVLTRWTASTKRPSGHAKSARRSGMIVSYDEVSKQTGPGLVKRRQSGAYSGPKRSERGLQRYAAECLEKLRKPAWLLAIAAGWPRLLSLRARLCKPEVTRELNLTHCLTHVPLRDPDWRRSRKKPEADARTRTGDPFITSELPRSGAFWRKRARSAFGPGRTPSPVQVSGMVGEAVLQTFGHGMGTWATSRWEPTV